MIKLARRLFVTALTFGLISGYSLLMAPNIEVKSRNWLDNTYSIQERETKHFMGVLPSGLENRIYEFKQLTDQNISERIAKEFRLNKYQDTIKKRLKQIPDVVAMPDLWLYLGFSSGFNDVNEAVAYYARIWNIIYTKDFSKDVLDHEYMHFIGHVEGGIFSRTYNKLFNTEVTMLNEGLVELYSQRLFYNYSDNFQREVAIAKIFDGRSKTMAEKLGYEPLAKAFFVDNSLSGFVKHHDEVYGKGAFKRLLKSIGNFK